MVLNMNIEEPTGGDGTKDAITNGYWSPNNNVKPKFSYDDILSSLNLSVSKNGVLQRMSIKTDPSIENKELNNGKKNSTMQNSRIEPEVKHSYIYNKYFKNYSGEGQQEVIIPRIPKTREEYRQMLIEDMVNRTKAKRRISQIKSTKMLYTNTNNTNYGNFAPTNVNRNNVNRLFRIKK